MSNFLAILLYTCFVQVSNAEELSQKLNRQIISVSKADGENVHYLEWKEVQNFIEQMQKEHQFDIEQLRQIFSKTRYVSTAIQLMKPAPPGKPKNWKAYRSRFVENSRIEAGIAFWQRNLDALTRAENLYGVPPEIIVGLIGVETIYGKTTGNFRAIDALSTLAFSYPDTPKRETRMAFFRSELAQLLIWSRETKIDVFSLKGSYAGALGLPQFMPSSIRQFAVDFDNDGKIDLKESEVDSIGSVANFLALHGWKNGLPYAFPATIQENQVDETRLSTVLAQGLKTTFLFNELNDIATCADAQIPKSIKYGLIDLQNGEDPTEYWFATDNFFAITQYNRSYFYAMSVIDLGKTIALGRKKD